MSYYVVDGAELTAIGNAIRTKAGTNSTMTLSAMVTTIDGISNMPSTSAEFATCLYGTASVITSNYVSGTLAGTLEAVNLPNCTSVYDSAFQGCSALRTVSLPACEYVGDDAFRNCGTLASINLPKCTSLGSSAFYGCSSLSMASLPKCSYIEEDTFYGCTSLTALYLLSNSVVSTYDTIPLSDLDGTGLSIYVPSGMLSDYMSSPWSHWYSNFYDMNGEWGGDYYDPTISTSSSYTS